MTEPTELSKVITFACDDCGGYGNVFIRQGKITSVEQCDCVMESLSTEPSTNPDQPLD